MQIPHPLLGLRDAAEFVCYGSAEMIDRPYLANPEQIDDQMISKTHDYVFLRDNPAGAHRELWYHEQGDRSWLVVTRDTLTHEILSVELAVEVARKQGRSL